MKSKWAIYSTVLLLILSFAFSALASPPSLESILERDMPIKVTKDIDYCKLRNTALKLDVYEPIESETLRPAMLLVHGGGWGGRDKSHPNFITMAEEYAHRGMVVFNINYRLSKTDPAPAAVQDTQCAARFIHANANKYRVDPNRIAATGNSAGCHLALMTAMCDSELCRGNGSWKTFPHSLRAVVNRFAITDAYERAFVQKRKSAIQWFTNAQGDAKDLARKMSPVNYTTEKEVPPILTIHGEKDTNTPVENGIRLHEGLKAQGKTSEIFIVPGGNHGLHNLSAEQRAEVEKLTYDFLLRNGVFK